MQMQTALVSIALALRYCRCAASSLQRLAPNPFTLKFYEKNP